MKSMKWMPVAAGIAAIGVVFVAGFFYRSSDNDPAVGQQVPSAPLSTWAQPEVQPAPGLLAKAGRSGADYSDYVAPAPPQAPQYERNAHMVIEVDDTIRAYEGLEARVVELGGEVVTMDLRGNDSGRQGTISMEIPVERFSMFVGENRDLGKVLDEHITAQRLPHRAQPATPIAETASSSAPLIALVQLTLQDKQIAPLAPKQPSVLSRSFSRSAGHFVRGLAVLVEGAGYFLPYALMLGMLFGAIWVFRRVRRRPAVATAR